MARLARHEPRWCMLRTRPSASIGFPPVTMALLVLHRLSHVTRDAYPPYEAGAILTALVRGVLGQAGSVGQRRRM